MKNAIEIFKPEEIAKNHKLIEGIWEIVREINQEFIPALSHRNSTVEKKLSAGNVEPKDNDEPDSYFMELLQQNIVVALYNAKPVGFISFKSNYVENEVEECCPCAYISTVGVKKEKRKQGVARMMYEFFLNHHLSEKYAVTRTWSSNIPHIQLLKELDFKLVKTIPNDRGAGIDTFYFCKNLK